MYAPYVPSKNRMREDFADQTGESFKRADKVDWLRINGDGNGATGSGKTALYGNLSVNGAEGGGGLTVGDWAAAGNGNIVATGKIFASGRDILAELDALQGKEIV